MNPWIQAARPKTLPLAISGILLGSAIAAFDQAFQWTVAIWGIITAVSLQVLSNFANDYGDFSKGTDTTANRQDRMLTSGKIGKNQMKKMIVIFSVFAFLSGILLLIFSDISFQIKTRVFVPVGIAAIAAAILYTMGKFAYAYSGFGDFFVFIFFGLVAVCGIYFLHTGTIHKGVIFASIGCGFLSMGVLNINNIRDIESDRESGKKTIPVRLGRRVALFYQLLLCLLGSVSIVYSLIYKFSEQEKGINQKELFLVIGVFSPVIISCIFHVRRMWELQVADGRDKFNSELKTLSLTALGASIIYCILAFMYV
ncbi:MAG: 1,4-dihydroxy-2-naphthoate octaprenyltransferase [Bacteroidetes bacterium]|nr:1,4-dihydroxy-2-naphthoate octaprenyltransferase [Bacteroidota bacterium]